MYKPDRDNGVNNRWRKTAVKGAVLLAIATQTASTIADDLSYNWLAVQQNEILREWIWQARICMSDYAQSLLMAGARDSEKLVDQLVPPCGGHLQNVLTQGMGVPADTARIYIRAMAYDALNRIPGLSQKSHSPDSRQSGGADTEDTDSKFSACLISKVHSGFYTSTDGGKSAKNLLAKCTREGKKWIQACVEAGDTKDSCTLKGTIAAQVAIKLFVE
jgi:hypothetical protein